MIELGLLGLRVGEVVSLDVGDVKNLDSPSRAVILVKRKGSKEQVLPLSSDARQALLRWLGVRPHVDTDALFFRIPFQPHRRDRLHYASVEKMFRQHATRAGLPIRKGQSFHSLRHSTAQRLADMDAPVQNIQALLRHASSDTTMVYYKVSDKRLRVTVERLNYAEGD